MSEIWNWDFNLGVFRVKWFVFSQICDVLNLILFVSFRACLIYHVLCFAAKCLMLYAIFWGYYYFLHCCKINAKIMMVLNGYFYLTSQDNTICSAPHSTGISVPPSGAVPVQPLNKLTQGIQVGKSCLPWQWKMMSPFFSFKYCLRWKIYIEHQRQLPCRAKLALANLFSYSALTNLKLLVVMWLKHNAHLLSRHWCYKLLYLMNCPHRVGGLCVLY